jgi:hypothetical protein
MSSVTGPPPCASSSAAAVRHLIGSTPPSLANPVNPAPSQATLLSQSYSVVAALLSQPHCRSPSRSTWPPNPAPVPWIEAAIEFTACLCVQPKSRGRWNRWILGVSCNKTEKVTNRTRVLDGFVQFSLINRTAPLLSLRTTRQGNPRRGVPEPWSPPPARQRDRR